MKLQTSRRHFPSSIGDGDSGGMPRSASGLCCVVTLLSAPLILNYLVGPCLVCHQSYTPHLIHTQTPLNNGDYSDNLRCSCVQKSFFKKFFHWFFGMVLNWCFEFESGIFVCLHWWGLQISPRSVSVMLWGAAVVRYVMTPPLHSLCAVWPVSVHLVTSPPYIPNYRRLLALTTHPRPVPEPESGAQQPGNKLLSCTAAYSSCWTCFWRMGGSPVYKHDRLRWLRNVKL